MYLGLIFLILVQAINVQALNFTPFGVPPGQMRANYLIARAEAGLIALRLKMRLLGGPEFLIGNHIEAIETDTLSLASLDVPDPSTAEYINVKFVDAITPTSSTYSWKIGRGRGMCVTTEDLEPHVALWNTGTVACAVLRVYNQYCDGGSFQAPMVGIGSGNWEDPISLTGSVFVYCEA